MNAEIYIFGKEESTKAHCPVGAWHPTSIPTRQLRVCRRISRFGRAFCRADVGIGPYKKIVGVLANTDDFVFSLHYRWTWRFMFSERKKVWKEPIRGSFRVQFPPAGGTVCEADHTRTNKEKTRQSVSFLYWCERWDLNSHDGCHTPLKRACLPIPALSHTISDCSVIILTAFVFVKCFISFWPDVPSQMSSI